MYRFQYRCGLTKFETLSQSRITVLSGKAGDMLRHGNALVDEPCYQAFGEELKSETVLSVNKMHTVVVEIIDEADVSEVVCDLLLKTSSKVLIFGFTDLLPDRVSGAAVTLNEILRIKED